MTYRHGKTFRDHEQFLRAAAKAVIMPHRVDEFEARAERLAAALARCRGEA